MKTTHYKVVKKHIFKHHAYSTLVLPLCHQKNTTVQHPHYITTQYMYSISHDILKMSSVTVSLTSLHAELTYAPTAGGAGTELHSPQPIRSPERDTSLHPPYLFVVVQRLCPMRCGHAPCY